MNKPVSAPACVVLCIHSMALREKRSVESVQHFLFRRRKEAL